ncbi:hypothetical protein [Floridanema evergladense]|uniref:Uncharacterized protein n=1 Tax=Floridaenema evergladense BLCC-F167 TaxID=3153639 RepID=A0ABV4WRR0_9CYAN
MPNPKKKLPTGPIRIDTPIGQGSSADLLQPKLEKEVDETKQETRKQDSNKLEFSKQETGKQEVSLEENIKIDSSKPDDSFIVSQIEESTLPESSQEEINLPEIRKQESSLPESINEEQEYKKVAMRLSAEAVETLKQLRVTTGVPYEILVDVMIRNWDNLPGRTQTSYLQQAKEARMKRLLAGQEKTMKTIRDKYSR